MDIGLSKFAEEAAIQNIAYEGRSLASTRHLSWAVKGFCGLFLVLVSSNSAGASQSVLMIVADDITASELTCYDSSSTADTPNICGLADMGLMATNAWANPYCSPTRATIQTGRYSFRTGVGRTVTRYGPIVLSHEEVTLPEVLDAYNRQSGSEIKNAAIGKWHLGNCLVGGSDATCDGGLYASHIGVEANLLDYFRFQYAYMINGKPAIPSEDYATRQQTQDAIDWIDQQSGQWFLYLAYNAPHEPFHVPPLDLLSQARIDALAAVGLTQANDSCPGTADEWEINRLCFEAMIEAMDKEIGRLLESVDLATTTVIFVGDNGSPGQVVPQGRAKGTLYQGGIHVPLIFAGAGVNSTGAQWDGLTDTVDLFTTTLDLLIGSVVDGLTRDGRSLVPMLAGEPDDGKDFVFAEYFSGLGTVRQTIRNTEYKLISTNYPLQSQCEPFNEAFYDLATDPDELNPLCSPVGTDLDNYTVLREALEELRDSTVGECPVRFSCNTCPDCETGENCIATDLGVESCQHPNRRVFQCPAGQTVHTNRCPCTGVDCLVGDGLTPLDLMLECRDPGGAPLLLSGRHRDVEGPRRRGR